VLEILKHYKILGQFALASPFQIQGDSYSYIVISLLVFKYVCATVGCVARWWNVGLSPANFPCPTLDLQLMGDHLYG